MKPKAPKPRRFKPKKRHKKPSWGGYSPDYKRALDHMDAICGRTSYWLRKI